MHHAQFCLCAIHYCNFQAIDIFGKLCMLYWICCAFKMIHWQKTYSMFLIGGVLKQSVNTFNSKRQFSSSLCWVFVSKTRSFPSLFWQLKSLHKPWKYHIRVDLMSAFLTCLEEGVVVLVTCSWLHSMVTQRKMTIILVDFVCHDRKKVKNLARFIRTCCTRRIRWSCEGLTSVHNEYTGWSLKHLLLRHMYNLSLPNLHATLQACLNWLRWAGAPDWSVPVTEWVCYWACRTVLYGALYSCLCRR